MLANMSPCSGQTTDDVSSKWELFDSVLYSFLIDQLWLVGYNLGQETAKKRNACEITFERAKLPRALSWHTLAHGEERWKYVTRFDGIIPGRICRKNLLPRLFRVERRKTACLSTELIVGNKNNNNKKWKKKYFVEWLASEKYVGKVNRCSQATADTLRTFRPCSLPNHWIWFLLFRNPSFKVWSYLTARHLK